MDQLSINLETELNRITTLLEEGPFLTIGAEDLNPLRQRARALHHDLQQIENQYLTVGLLGGTGVGKSTLMNALAGAEIASPSHRRPQTDRVLIYRHEEAVGKRTLNTDGVPVQHISHSAEAIKQVLLCDMPDFDSIVSNHLQSVRRFVGTLDLIVWVTSPEKYGDGRFYELLESVPKARHNFYFVLNKTDLLFQGEFEKGFDRLSGLLDRFKEHLNRHGVTDPLIYAVSGSEAVNQTQTSLWNQFPIFKREIFQQRDLKQVTAIKASNLEVETRNLSSAFQDEIAELRSFGRLIRTLMDEIKSQQEAWVADGVDEVSNWLTPDVTTQLVDRVSNPTCLTGAAYVYAFLFKAWQHKFAGGGLFGNGAAQLTPPIELTQALQRRIAWVDDRFTYLTLNRALTASVLETLRQIFRSEERIQDFKERLSGALSAALSRFSSSSFLGLRVFQSITHVVLIGLFLMALAGEKAWRLLWSDPGIASVGQWVVASISTLFSAKGLAALGSILLLELFLGFRFYRRYKKAMGRVAGRAAERCKAGVANVWKETLRFLLTDLENLQADLETRIERMTGPKTGIVDHTRRMAKKRPTEIE
jgi:GTP-binding protein EngB required for normal cell division